MKKLIELGNLYASKSDWKDFALVKFCLFSMGLLIGINAPKKHQKTVTVLSALVFAVTYVPLMSKLLRIAAEREQYKYSISLLTLTLRHGLYCVHREALTPAADDFLRRGPRNRASPGRDGNENCERGQPHHRRECAHTPPL